jgi:hypothetical protein
MAITGASTRSSTTAAASAAAGATTSAADLVNVPTGYPAPQRWPGALDPGQYSDAGPGYPIEGPPADPWILNDWQAQVPPEIQGGGVQDLSWTTGTNGPQAPWDSNAGEAFAPSGAAPPELHGQDTGAVWQAQHVVPAAIGQLIRASIPAQAYSRAYAFDPVTGQNVPTLAGRMNLDQQQRWDPAPGDGGGWAPWDPGYAERPLQANLAYQATAVRDVATAQGVAGALPDRSPWNAYAAQTYASPPDPIVNPPAAAAAADFIGGWQL